MKKNRRDENSSQRGLLSDDIIEHNILPRLPVKSLFRFKCVCKKWCSVTDDPVFRQRHSLTLEPPSGLVYWDGKMLFLSTDERSISVPDPTLSFLGKFVRVTSSCNGLICGFYVREDIWPGIFVCNPVTKEMKSIPNPERRHLVGLAFNPSIPDPYYKLLCPYKLHKNGIRTEYGFDVFSSRTRKWEKSKQRILIPSGSTVTSRSFFVDEVLYFWATCYVVWMHTDKDIAGVQPLPSSSEMITSTLGKCKSRLSYTQVTSSDIQIWILNDFSWELMRCARLDILHSLCPPAVNIFNNQDKVNRSFRPLPLVLDDVFIFQVGVKVYFYNMETRQVSEKGGRLLELWRDVQAHDCWCIFFWDRLLELWRDVQAHDCWCIFFWDQIVKTFGAGDAVFF